MTLVLAQTVTGAQGANPQLLIVFGIIGLAVLVALGGKFFINLFEIITAPAASLGHHGKSDQFFFSVFVVFLGGLIGSVIMLIKQAAIVAAFTSSAETICDAAAQLNANSTYRVDAMNWGISQMLTNFDVYVVANFIFFPVVVALVWLLAGVVLFMFTRLLGGQCTLSEFLGSVAYGSFFMAIGFGMVSVMIAENVQMLQTKSLSSQMDVLAIIGLVVFIYGIILYLIGMSQGAGMTGGQVLGAILLYVIILAGIVYMVTSQVAQPRFEDFQQDIQNHNPARG